MVSQSLIKTQKTLADIQERASSLHKSIGNLIKMDMDRRSSAPDDIAVIKSRNATRQEYRHEYDRLEVLMRRLERHHNEVLERINRPLTRYAPTRVRSTGRKSGGKKAAAA